MSVFGGLVFVEKAVLGNRGTLVGASSQVCWWLALREKAVFGELALVGGKSQMFLGARAFLRENVAVCPALAPSMLLRRNCFPGDSLGSPFFRFGVFEAAVPSGVLSEFALQAFEF